VDRAKIDPVPFVEVLQPLPYCPSPVPQVVPVDPSLGSSLAYNPEAQLPQHPEDGEKMARFTDEASMMVSDDHAAPTQTISCSVSPIDTTPDQDSSIAHKV
jgi:hypothetical protein